MSHERCLPVCGRGGRFQFLSSTRRKQILYPVHSSHQRLLRWPRNANAQAPAGVARLAGSRLFHCTYDKQAVRDAVYDMISRHDFTVQATIMEKSKAQPQVRKTEDRFYKYAWLYHLRHSSNRFLSSNDSLMVTAATIGKAAKRVSFEDSVRDVCKQIVPNKSLRTAFWPSQTDPCLQLADYCTWAIQRKWERGDARSYDLIAKKINYEFNLWEHGNTHYY